MLTSRAPVVGVSGRAETRPFSARCPDVIHSQLRLQEGRLKQSRKTRSRLSFSLDLVRSFHCICLIFFRVMSSCTVVFTLLCSAVLSGSSARRSSPDLEDVQGKIDSARCTSRCLTLHMTQLTAAFKHIQVNTCLSLE